MSGFPWDALGIRETGDRTAIRKAYSERLRSLDLDRQIAEYAELREARDYALHLASHAPAADDFGLGLLDDDEGPAQETAPLDYEGGEDAFRWEIGDDDLAADAGDDELATAALAHGELEPAGQRSDQAPPGWERLAEILFPGGEHSDGALTLDEAEEGKALLDSIVVFSEQGDLIRHAAVDHNLAEMLAGSWPRSAPLVGPANDAFHWLGEAGGLDERPALQFLNARTRGLRFHEAVLQEGHPLHAAWVELSRPGKSTVLDRLKIKRIEVESLLKTIRTHFPELESLLDWERVASWETPSNDAVSYVIQRLFIGFLIFSALRFCASIDDRGLENPPVIVTEQSARQEGLDIAAAAAFGEDMTFARIEAADPEFAGQFAEYLGPVRGSTLFGDPRAFVRNRVRSAREDADFDALVAIQDVQLDWLRAAEERGAAACLEVIDGSFRNGGPGVTQEVLTKEQMLAITLLDRKLLRKSSVARETQLEVPGWLIDAAVSDTGMTREGFVEIMQQPDHPGRCKVEIALIAAMLSKPGQVPIETLRGL